MNNYQLQRLFAWSGLAAVCVFFVGFLTSSFIPPPSPSWTVEHVVAHYGTHASGIRLGMVLMMISGMLFLPFVGIIAQQLKRIGSLPVAVVYTQIGAGTLNAVFFIVPAILFIVTAFRPERPAEITFALNDMCWIMAILPWSPAFMQSVTIGLAILRDAEVAPVFPRWLGFLNFWVALGYIPGSLLAFFKSGPFAWNGIFAFWLAGSVFFLWFVAMTVMLIKAINRQELAAAG